MHLAYAKDKLCKENDTYIEKDELATVNNEECSEITEESTDKNKNETISSDIKSVIDILNNDNITEFEFNKLFEAMGNFFNMDVDNRSKLMMNNVEYKKFTKIPPIELYLKKFNPSLINFLICLTKYRKGMAKKPLNQIAMIIITNIKYLATRNAKFIGPHSFSQGLVKCSLHDSKTAHTMDRVSSVSGSVATLRGVLKDNADNNRNFCFSSGDVDVFADNTKKGKTWERRSNNTTKCSHKCCFYSTKSCN